MAARQTSGKAERGLRTDPSPLPPLQGELTENQDWARAHHRGSLSAAEPSRSSERDPCKAAAPRTSSHLGGQSRVSAARNERERPASSGREVTIARPARREGRSPQTLEPSDPDRRRHGTACRVGADGHLAAASPLHHEGTGSEMPRETAAPKGRSQCPPPVSTAASPSRHYRTPGKGRILRRHRLSDRGSHARGPKKELRQLECTEPLSRPPVYGPSRVLSPPQPPTAISCPQRLSVTRRDQG